MINLYRLPTNGGKRVDSVAAATQPANLFATAYGDLRRNLRRFNPALFFAGVLLVFLAQTAQAQSDCAGGSPALSGDTIRVCAGTTINLNNLLGGDTLGVVLNFLSGVNPVVNPSAVTPGVGINVYTVIGTNMFGCSDTTSIIVNVDPKPILVGGTFNLPTGVSVSLDSLLGSLNVGNLLGLDIDFIVNGDTIANPAAFFPAGGTNVITVIGTDPLTLLTATTQLVLNVCLPPVLLGDTLNLCLNVGASVNLDNLLAAVNVGNLLGLDIDFLLNGTPIGNTGTFVPSVGVNGITVIGTNLLDPGCADTTQLVLNVSMPPLLVGDTLTICAGVSVDLTTLLNGNLTGLTIIFRLGGINGTNVGNIVTPGVGVNLYAAISTNGSGCSDTTSITVIVNPAPVVIGDTITVCAGVSVDLGSLLTGDSASFVNVFRLGGVNGAIVAQVVVPPVGTTIYAAISTNGLGCSDTTAITVIVQPTAGLVQVNTNVCAGATIDLTGLVANYDSLINPIFTVGVIGGPVVVNPALVSISAATTFFLVTQSPLACVDTTQIIVTVNPAPIITGDTITICAGVQVDLRSLLIGDSASFTNIFILGGLGGTPVSNLVTPAIGTNIYAAISTNGLGCSDTTSITVIVQPVPNIIGDTITVCAGVNVNLSSVLSGDSASFTNVFLLNGSVVGNIVTPGVGVNVYAAISTNGLGCSDTTTITVIVQPVPNIMGDTLNLCLNAGVAVNLNTLIGGNLLGLNLNFVLGGNSIANPAAFVPSVGANVIVVIGTNLLTGCADTTQLVLNVSSPVNFMVVAQPVTCTSESVANADGTLVVSGVPAGARFTFSASGSISGAAASFASSQPVLVGGIIVANLTNPGPGGQVYTVRIWTSEFCFTDKSVTLLPTDCACEEQECIPFTVKLVKRVL
ncbi:MAG: hypothetical protein LH606_10285 [Cytophagaceae bacterium]|nr:hypothetical protein [Cytophagaceae bacterium]